MGGRSGGPSRQTWTGTQDGGHGGVGSAGGHGRWSSGALASSLGQATPARTLRGLGGIRNPPGLDTQNSTRQDRKAIRGQTDRTGQPTGTGSPPGLAWKLRLPLGMTRSQRPSQGPSATASISATREAGGWNGLRGHKTRSRLPQTSLHGQDRHDD